MRILQLNLWNLNEPLADRMRVLAEGIAVLAPDVVTFQEVSANGSRLQFADLADALGYRSFYADSRPAGGRREGNAVLSRLPAVACETRRLPHPELDPPRVALCCTFDGLGDRPVSVVSTHLAHQRDAAGVRAAQAREVVDLIRSAGATESFVLGADLNSDPASEAVGEILSLPGASDAWLDAGGHGPGFTTAGTNPYVGAPPETGARIDYVIVGAGLRAVSCRVVFTGADHRVASDHYGLVADIVVR